MITLTKEWLLKTIAELEEERDATPGVVNLDAAMALAAMKLALASLEADRKLSDFVASQESLGVEFEGVLTENIEELCVPSKSTPPAPVSVPDELSREEYKRLFMQEDNFNDTFRGGWNACRAAMLQGADKAPVKQPSSNSIVGWLRADYRDDNRSLRGNAPLFVLGKKDPSTVWGLDYIPLTSNSPVIPDGWVVLPAEPTQAMMNAWLSEVANWRGHAAGYRAMIAAAPQQGGVLNERFR